MLPPEGGTTKLLVPDLPRKAGLRNSRHLARCGSDRIMRIADVAEKQCLLREVDVHLESWNDDRACRTSQDFDAREDADSSARGGYIVSIQLQKIGVIGIKGHDPSSLTPRAIKEDIVVGIVKSYLHGDRIGRIQAIGVLRVEHILARSHSLCDSHKAESELGGHGRIRLRVESSRSSGTEHERGFEQVVEHLEGGNRE